MGPKGRIVHRGVVAMGGGGDIGGWSGGGAVVVAMVGVSDAIVAVGVSQGLGASREGACGTGGAGKDELGSYTIVLVSHTAELLAWVVSKGV